MTRILQVVSPNSEATYVASQKAEGGQVVAASLRFQVREVNGQMYQETTATDMLKLI